MEKNHTNVNKVVQVEQRDRPPRSARVGSSLVRGILAILMIHGLDGMAAVQATPNLPDVPAMQGLPNPRDGDAVLVLDPGRGGLFVFEADALLPSDGGTLFKAADATPGSWVRRYVGPASVKWFGAVGDGITDDSPALQAAATFGTIRGVEIYAPPGTYVMTVPLLLTDQAGYSSVVWRGSGSGALGTPPRTVFDAKAIVDNPAFVITQGQNVVLEDFAILGPNLAPAAQTHGEQFYDAVWVTEGVRDERYSPQCAIGVDANAGAVPPDGGYPGLVYTGSRWASHRVTFSRLNLVSHVVGIMYNPGLNLNGDPVEVHDCNFVANKVHIAVGQAQAKGFEIRGSNFLVGRTVYDGLEYGQRQGRGPQFFGCQFMLNHELVSWNAGFGPAVFIGGYAEQLFRIGYGGVSTGISNGIHFHGTDIKLLSDFRARSPIVFEGRNTTFNYYGGRFGAYHFSDKSTVAYNILSANTSFDGTFISINDKYRPLLQGPAGLKFPVTLRNCRVADTTTTKAVYYGVDTTGTTLTDAEAAHPDRIVAHHVRPPTTVTPYDGPSRTYEYVHASGGGEVVAPGTSSNVVRGERTLTFDNTDAVSFLVGDVVCWRMKPQGASSARHIVPALRVIAVSPPTVTCEYLFRPVDYDDTYAPGANTLLTVPRWAPGVALTADTNGSTTLSNVSPTTILRNGDFINAASGIAPFTRVVSGGGTDTITLNRPATDTATGKSLYWDRMYVSQREPAFSNKE